MKIAIDASGLMTSILNYNRSPITKAMFKPNEHKSILFQTDLK